MGTRFASVALDQRNNSQRVAGCNAHGADVVYKWRQRNLAEPGPSWRSKANAIVGQAWQSLGYVAKETMPEGDALSSGPNAMGP